MIHRVSRDWIFLFSSLLIGHTTLAQNTGGVFSPVVNAGHQSAQYRVSYAAKSDAEDSVFAHRLHYQQAIDDNLMWRVVGQVRETTASNLDPDYLQAELFWEISDADDFVKTGLRFDARVRSEGRPKQVGINWTTQIPLNRSISVRGILLTSAQIGEDAPEGLDIQTRFSVTKAAEGGTSYGLELYNTYGNTQTGFGSFNQQNHAAGPFYQFRISPQWSLYTSALVGVSDAANNLEARLRLISAF